MQGKDIKLTGNQIKFIREKLGETQKAFSDRIAVTQPVIHRLEKKGDEEMTGPDIICINQIAIENGIKFPVVKKKRRGGKSSAAEGAENESAQGEDVTLPS